MTQDAPSSVVDVKQFVSLLTTTFLNAMPAADARNLPELALIAKEWCSQTSKKWSNPKKLKRAYRILDDRWKQQIGRQYHEWHKDTLRNHDIQLEFCNACLKLSRY
jgi:hypothetical protein